MRNLNVCRSMECDEIYCRVLSNFTDVAAKPLSIFEQSQQSCQVLGDWKRETKVRKEDPGNYSRVSLPSVPGKTLTQILLEAVLRQRENREVIGDTQHDFITDKSS